MRLPFGVFRLEDAKKSPAEIRERLKKVGAVLAGFLAGAIFGAFLFVNFGLLAVFLPGAMILLTAVQSAKTVEDHSH